jgi:hypothetical protein
MENNPVLVGLDLIGRVKHEASRDVKLASRRFYALRTCLRGDVE